MTYQILKSTKNALQIIRFDNKKKYVICAQTPQEKKIWVTDLSKIIDEYLRKEHGTQKESLRKTTPT